MSYRRHYFLFGQGPQLPRWLRVAYQWVIITLGGTFVSWLGFRAFAGSVRGDLGPALTSLAIGAVVATVVTWYLHRRVRHGRR